MSDGRSRVIAIVIAVGVFGGLVAGCGEKSSPSTSSSSSSASGGGDKSLDRAKGKGLYPAFYGEEPYAFIDYKTGEYTGLEPEVVKYCAKQLGMGKIYPVQQPWDGLIPGLVAGRYDLIAAGMSTSPERRQVATPTQAMYRAGSRAMVAKGNPRGIHSWNDLATKKLTMGYITGGLEGKDAKKFGVKTKGYETLDAMVADLKAGRIDAIVTAEITLRSYIKRAKAPFEMATPWDYQGVFFTPALWFKKADASLREGFDGCITEMKKNGEFEKLLTTWGFGAQNLLPAGAKGAPEVD
jgi:polar amino acid transport system substrate-binding protein